MNMLRQFLVGGGVSLVNIAIHALIMTMVVQVARVMSTKRQPHSSLVLIAVMIPTISVLMAAHTIEVCLMEENKFFEVSAGKQRLVYVLPPFLRRIGVEVSRKRDVDAPSARSLTHER